MLNVVQTSLRFAVQRGGPWLWRVLFLLGGAVWAAGSVSAQLIPVKTAPVATGSQFRVVPGDRYGMGGVSIAVRDLLGDAFVNPAKAARLESSLVFTHQFTLAVPISVSTRP